MDSRTILVRQGKRANRVWAIEVLLYLHPHFNVNLYFFVRLDEGRHCDPTKSRRIRKSIQIRKPEILNKVCYRFDIL